MNWYMKLKEGRWVASWSWFYDVEGWICHIWMQQLFKMVFSLKMNTQNGSFRVFFCIKAKLYFTINAAQCDHHVGVHSIIYSGYLPTLLILLLVTEAAGPALISRCCGDQQIPWTSTTHLQSHHNLYLLSPGSSLWEKSVQTTLIHPQSCSSLPRFDGTARSWKMLFSPFNLNNILLSAEMSSAFFSDSSFVPWHSFLKVECYSYFSVALPDINNMNLLE